MANQIDKHLASFRLKDARDAFDQVVAQYVEDADSPFRNAAYWALDALYPEPSRALHGFRDLPRPCVPARLGPFPAKATKAANAAKPAKLARAQTVP